MSQPTLYNLPSSLIGLDTMSKDIHATPKSSKAIPTNTVTYKGNSRLRRRVAGMVADENRSKDSRSDRS